MRTCRPATTTTSRRMGGTSRLVRVTCWVSVLTHEVGIGTVVCVAFPYLFSVYLLLFLCYRFGAGKETQLSFYHNGVLIDKNSAFSNVKGAEEGWLRPVVCLQGEGSVRVHFGDFKEGITTGLMSETDISSMATRGCAEAIYLHHSSMGAHDMRSMYSLQHINHAIELHESLDKKINSFPAEVKSKVKTQVARAQQKLRCMFSNPCLDMKLQIEGDGVEQLLSSLETEEHFLQDLAERLGIARQSLSVCYPWKPSQGKEQLSSERVHLAYGGGEDPRGSLETDAAGRVSGEVVLRVTYRGYSITHSNDLGVVCGDYAKQAGVYTVLFLIATAYALMFVLTVFFHVFTVCVFALCRIAVE